MIKNVNQLINFDKKLVELSERLIVEYIHTQKNLFYVGIYSITEIAKCIGAIETEIKFYEEMKKKWYWFILKHFLP
ncbi:hypothetical protein A2356_01625 [Candidatus Nomurabacteria bacterium RIFOXYB1_FULL_39_16]|uniref:Uncharacterized protein n=1 Tax=Candidatus Nomurabacteria bacterium RIFOXYB1_FULL_39_16 TaxID=1801803 RepID=A0A1F6YRQ6_9BACT|nr:MAG: hypothetical protein A2356_01625 [Candidatus Nomurabacteria bacterium RIFOXYB1_FULL_39_16]